MTDHAEALAKALEPTQFRCPADAYVFLKGFADEEGNIPRDQLSRIARTLATPALAGTEPAGEVVEVSVKPMKLSDGRCDYFVSFRCGDREVTPHVFREQFKAEYHVALYRWAFGQGDEPDLMAFDENEWPGRKYTATPPATLRDQSEA